MLLRWFILLLIYRYLFVLAKNINYDSQHQVPILPPKTVAPGYTVQEELVKHYENGLEIPLKIQLDQSVYGKPIHELIVYVDYETKDRIHVKIVDKDHQQPIVPDSPMGVPRPSVLPVYTRNYEFQYTSTPSFGFQVVRKLDDHILFDTTDTSLVFEDQYLELTTHVPEEANIYGFGETTAPFRRTHNTTAMFTTGPHTPYGANVYGHHPFYIEIREGKAHGAMLLNAHGTDVVLDKGSITWKTIGGILDFYIFIPRDTEPDSVIRSYTDVIGNPVMPALWTLGWHQCRYGLKNVTEVEQVLDQYKEHQIPLETMWLDIDYMDQWKSFTLDPINYPKDKIIDLRNRLHQNDQHLVTILEPAFGAYPDYSAYRYGQELDIFMKNPDGSEYQGLVWPGYTAFTDSWHPNAPTFWNKQVGDWMQEIQPDGVWLDMNEPYSHCLGSCGTGRPAEEGIPLMQRPNNERETKEEHDERKKVLDEMVRMYSKDTRNLLYPGYKIHNYFGDLSEQTVAMSTLHHGDIPHYDLHSLYGHAQVYLVYQALLNHNKTERPFILTRSSFAGTGKYASHWTGDISSVWSSLRSSIPGILNFQLFGIPQTGADICGFLDEATEELCTRWHALGAFYPFARNHVARTSKPHYPYNWESTAEATRRALAIRYTLIPYLYTLFEEAHSTGLGPWRPLIFRFRKQEALLDNDRQVLIGDSLLLSPVLDQGTTTVDAQFPMGQVWYDWYTNALDVDTTQSSEVVTKTLDAPLEHIPLHIRGGSILPLKTTPHLVLKETIATPYTFLIALDQKGTASGTLFIDDGHTIEPELTTYYKLEFKDGKLEATGGFDYPNPEPLSTIKVLGKQVNDWSHATYDSTNFSLSKQQGIVVLENINIPLKKEFTIQFY
ncbi:alpha glucosidase [Phascolomyces articulosus]|uniref:Maltase n=1 Tax=Phascolomyces articulosus TaxID=60185 RepID=A0AAD5JZW4_9FUNG|nr:alpha glucosidase [Phascolomyces articulosus]